VPGAVLVVDDAAGVRTAYVEAAHAVGPMLVAPADRDPGRGTSSGVGELLALARSTGARRVVVGVADAATTDAGAGMLAALGVGGRSPGAPTAGPDALTGGGLAAGAVTDVDLAGLDDVRREWSGVELVVACGVDLPLLGMHGTAAGATAQGASVEESQALERALGHFAHAAVAALGPGAVRPDLLAGPRSGRAAAPAARLTGLPGAGAGGGLGFGLALLGARLHPGAALVADEVGLAARLGDVDLAVTGAAAVDPRSLHDGVIETVAQRAMGHGVPTVVIAGEVLVGRRELASAGVSAAYPVTETAEARRAAADDPAGVLASRAGRVARTWSR